MSKSRLPMYLGAAAAGAGGFYLYKAGGDPKRATQRFEDDASRAAHKVTGGEPGAGEQKGARAGAKVDEAAETAQDKLKKADTKVTDYAKEEADRLEKARKDAAKNINDKIDNIDQSVEKKASEAKSGISSWFGGGKKD